MVTRLALCLAVSVLGACSNAAPAPSATPVNTPDPASVGTITGRIVLDGSPPAAQRVRLDADPKCVTLASGEERRTEYVVMGEGNALQHVFVYIKDGLPMRMYAVPSTPAVLDQQQCRYVPRVLGAQVGQQVVIRNSDPLLHNVRAEALINEMFDVGTPVQGVEVKRTFATREVMVPFKCSVHPWMNAYLGVLEHPFFAVSDAQGRFAIGNVPPGTYTLEIWHERLGTQTQQVIVEPQTTRDLSFTFKVS